MTLHNDDHIRAFLADEAWRVTSTAPSLDEMVERLAPRLAPRASAPARPLVVLLAASLLLVAVLATAIAVGSGLVRLPTVINPVPSIGEPSYEAVLLRLVTDGREHEVVVVGVDPGGSEREIARIPDGWVLYDVGDGHLAPMGAVSTSGLLAMPAGNSGAMQWSIHDLHQPDAEPLVVDGAVQDIEQLQFSPYFSSDMRPSVFWGPDDQVAIPWYGPGGELDYHVTYVNARTRAEASVDVPEAGLPWIYPAWASDGSGVLLSRGLNEAPSAVLRPDGTVVELEAGDDGEPACRTEYGSGAELSIEGGGIDRLGPDGTRESFTVPGDLNYACLSPDEGVVVADIGIGDGTGEVTAARPMAGLLVPETDSWTLVEGSFAGWMEVTR